ncbi:hypothetical protein SAY87_000086 [Trapa incisa]|uniref:Uncharacterized protein n=1 Tax=Trapa incisa TaxID=236973 RepID=A0AAN7GB64_9MYRT|nr:hypothetical protein SAY87_000086 [Trapa incisa]
MEHYFHDDDLHYAVEEFYDDFDDENLSGGAEAAADSDCGSTFSDFDDDFESNKSKTDSSALEARNGKDIQGIPWERMNYSRDVYRENTREEIEAIEL